MKTYLFDFDGTLVDSMPTYSAIMLRILDESGVKYEKDILKTVTPLGFIDTARYFINELGMKAEHGALVALMKERAIEEYSTRVPAKADVKETLEELKARGCSLNVLTASPHDTLDPCLKRLGMYGLFDNVWSCNDFQTNKSDPEIYKMAARRLGREASEIIFLDDNPEADKTAKLAGMRVIGVFDESSAEYADEMKRIADGYIYSFKELL